MSHFYDLRHGKHLGGRAVRSSALTVLGYGGSQALRLASNLILTRLLFPEAFGLMSLVWMILQGLANFSDTGVVQSILQSKRGDEKAFLDTAWTIQVLRGLILWLLTWALAAPAATFYDAPELREMLPVVGFTLFITGLFPTKRDSANRKLILGRLTAIDLCSQMVGLVAGILVAWMTGSVWALVVGTIFSTTIQLILSSFILPGELNSLRLEKSASWEMIHFGKWIFPSTVAGFLISQGDKIILGKFLSLAALGVYNIGYFLASFPLLLGSMVVHRVMIPVYREKPPSETQGNATALSRMRIGISAGLFALLFGFATLGVWLVSFLYDPRYESAGAIVVLLTIAQIPQLIALTYDIAALAAGDSKGYFITTTIRAILMMAGLMVGVSLNGLIGALIGQGLAMTFAYLAVVRLARAHRAWDPLHDMLFWTVGAIIAGTSIWLNWNAIIALSALKLP
ncbi:oligosaccharide flippase family protein [Pseudopelagicola sp. nBUS_19]|uniref:oligosaccharide flippase family protein n=1 Tax=unclassified Pseudopelagicola TaxID=2649563 RepID=UPI003EBDA587